MRDQVGRVSEHMQALYDQQNQTMKVLGVRAISA
jgi:hypothetical protein